MNRFLSALTVCCLLAMAGCGASHHPDHADSSSLASVFGGEYPMKVVCTTGQVAEMIVRIGGAHVHVDNLMGPGVDPHLYRPIASDVRKLDSADAIFYNGMHLEGRMVHTFEQMARRKATFAVTKGLIDRKDPRLREPPEFEGLYDPHVWHDVALWSDCVRDMAEKLVQFDPNHADDYQKNAATYIAELAELDTFCTSQIATIPKKSTEARSVFSPGRS